MIKQVHERTVIIQAVKTFEENNILRTHIADQEKQIKRLKERINTLKEQLRGLEGEDDVIDFSPDMLYQQINECTEESKILDQSQKNRCACIIL